ncbi:unnamed protein product, partial [Lymnaea stagnalis]
MTLQVVSCSGSGEIFYTDVDREDTYGSNRFDCHFGTTYKLLVVPNEAATFLSCGDDGTVRFFDLRTKTSCSKFNCEEDVVIHLSNAVTAMAVDPIIPFHLAVASSDGIVRLYDRRMLKTRETGGSSDSLIGKFPPPMTNSEKRHYRITSLNYRQGSHDVLVNYSSENIYLFNTYEINKQQCYTAGVGFSASSSQPVAGPSQDIADGVGPEKASVAQASTDNGSDNESAFKPIKRLRLRGDWSDTGPDARPESEEPALTNTIMQRMSDLLTRMLNSRSDRTESQEDAQGEDPEAATDVSLVEDDLEVPDFAVAQETTVISDKDKPVNERHENTPSAQFSISSEGVVSSECLYPERESFDVNNPDRPTTSQYDASKTQQNTMSDSNSLHDVPEKNLDNCLTSGLDSTGCQVAIEINSWEDPKCVAEKSCTDQETKRKSSKKVEVADEKVVSERDMITHRGSADTGKNDAHMEGASTSLCAFSGPVKTFVNIDSSSESNDSISDQMSVNLYIAQAQNWSPQSFAEDFHFSTETTSSSSSVVIHPTRSSTISRNSPPPQPFNSPSTPRPNNPLMSQSSATRKHLTPCTPAPSSSSVTLTPGSSLSLLDSANPIAPPVESLLQYQVSSASELVLGQLDLVHDSKKIQKEYPSWTVQPVFTWTTDQMSPLTKSSESSTVSSPSYSDSPFAIAEGAISGFEGNETLNDVLSLSSTPVSNIHSISELTPSSINTADFNSKSSTYHTTALLEQVGALSQSAFLSNRKTHRSVSKSTPHNVHLSNDSWGQTAASCSTDTNNGENCPKASPVPHNSQKIETVEMEADDEDPGICSVCGVKLKRVGEELNRSSLKLSLCKQCHGRTIENLPKFSSKDHQHLPSMTSENILNQDGSQTAILLKTEPENATLEFGKSDMDKPESPSATGIVIKEIQGKGKSNLKAKKSGAKADKFAPYNSGKMMISTEGTETSAPSFPLLETSFEVPSTSSIPSIATVYTRGHSSETFPSQYVIQDSTGTAISRQPERVIHDSPADEEDQERPPKALYRLPGLKSSSQGFEQRRRVGYSLPPTGNFQLHSDDDMDEDDDQDEGDDESHMHTRRKLKLEKERLSVAAQKIQSVYRKKREAREMAKMVEVPQPRMIMKYSGHRNCRTMIKEANFYGEHYVISGSDCGRLLAWERETGRMVMYMDADKHVVNCVQPNLFVPVIASSGIDYDIKIWS